VPVVKAVMSSVVAPLLQLYVNGPVPPVTVKSMLPLLLPHVASTWVVLTFGPPMLLMVALVLALQPLLSVTDTL
jgi:hypothetical protein